MATFTGTAANETITPTTVSGTVTRDPLGTFPSAADDFINGNGGNDTLDGGGGNDQIFSGSGNDTILGGAGNDTINAGDGTNTVDGGDGGDSITGGAGADTITGGLGNDAINGGAGGADQIDAGAGDDQIFVTTAWVSLNAGAGTDQVTISGATGNTINLATAGIEVISSGNGNDDIDGSGQTVAVSITGNLGDDILKGGTASDAINGGSGNNTISGNAGDDTIFSGGGNDTILGGVGNDTINAGDGTNTVDGGDGGDSITGGAGADIITGGLGNDAMNAGAGTDTVSYGNATSGVTVDLGLTIAQDTIGAGIDTLFNFENLTGSIFNDTLTGDSGNNALTGGGGNDNLDGGTGTDTASYSNATAGVAVNLSLTTAQNTVGAGTDTLSNLENLTGSNFNDTLIGTAGNNILNGLGAVDIVSYANATAGVTVDLNLTTAQNTVGAGTDTLLNLENLTGSNFNDTLTGNSGTNVLSGGGGNDLLDGGTGSDTVSYANAAAGVIVSLAIAGAQNTIGAGTDTVLNFENLRGSNFNDTLTGNAASNVIIGHLGDDLLDGGAGTDTASYETSTTGVTVSLAIAGAQNTIGAGTDTLINFEHLRGGVANDTLTGNGGSNILTGGLGNDILDGGAGSDTASYDTAFGGVTVSLLIAGAQNTVNAGTDTLSNLENLKGSIHNDTLTGNAASNVIIGDLGNDVLNGDAGIDTASYETAKMGVTVSLALAGAQNTVGAGTDTLSNFENLRGGNFNDTLTGNTGANQLTGGLGNDTLTGNGGADSFVFNTALNAVTNTDTITDFAPVDDTLVLENAIFTQFGATGAIPAGTFVANAGAVAGDANDFLLYDTSNGKLFYDADGNGAGAKVEFVTLVGIPALTIADFTVI